MSRAGLGTKNVYVNPAAAIVVRITMAMTTLPLDLGSATSTT